MPLLTEFAGIGLTNYGFSRGGAAGNALELISTQLLSSTTSTVTFSGIPSTFKHLQVRITARQDTSYTVSSLLMRLNSDSGSNYSWHRLQAGGGSVSSGAFTSQSQMGIGVSTDAGSTSNAFGGFIVDILDYANTNKNKTVRTLGGFAVSSNVIELKSGAWYNTSAVNALSFTGDGSYVAGSRFSLYGVK